jgi:hypothetical protein
MTLAVGPGHMVSYTYSVERLVAKAGLTLVLAARFITWSGVALGVVIGGFSRPSRGGGLLTPLGKLMSCCDVRQSPLGFLKFCFSPS